MTDDRSLERAARSWLEAGPTAAPDRVVEAALLRIQTTPQERDLRIPWRTPKMLTPARLAVAVVIGALLVAGAFMVTGGRPRAVLPIASPMATPTATPLPPATEARSEEPLAAGRYYRMPFVGSELGLCMLQTGCTESSTDDTMRFTFTVPDGWVGGQFHAIFLGDGGKGAPRGAGLGFVRGGWLYEKPCGDRPPPIIRVGPTAAEFAQALADHPGLDVTTPVDVTLAGYSGKYVDLQVPSDLSACPEAYYPWEPGIYAQGPNQRWHLWILDVKGDRVVVQAMDYAGTDPRRQAELTAIVQSLQIDP